MIPNLQRDFPRPRLDFQAAANLRVRDRIFRSKGFLPRLGQPVEGRILQKFQGLAYEIPGFLRNRNPFAPGQILHRVVERLFQDHVNAGILRRHRR